MSVPQAFRVTYRRAFPMLHEHPLCVEILEAESLEHLLAQFEMEPDYDQVELISVEPLAGEL